MRKRRVIRLVALLATVLVLSIVGLVQTPPVRRAVLARVSASTEKSLGFSVQAGRLDFNLLTARVAAEKVSLRHAAARDLSPFLSADRVSIRLRYSSLLRGSFAAADLRVEGLRLQGIVRKDGSGNLPPKLFESTGSQDLRLPIDSIEVSGLSLAYDYERAGLSVRIPAASLRISTPQPGGDQDLHCELLPGSSVHWDGKNLPVDQLKLDALLQSSQALIRSFQLTSASSTIQAQGSYWSGTASRLYLSADGDLDLTALSPWIGLTEPLTGRIKAKVQVSGAPSRLSAEGKLNSDLLRLGEFQWDSISTWARLSPGADALEWKDLKAGMYAGQLASSGRLALMGQGESSLSAELKQLDLRKLPTGKGSSRLPAGKASVRMTAACRGLDWSSAQMKASAAVQLHRGLPSTGSSTITRN